MRNYMTSQRPKVEKELTYGHEHNSMSMKRKRLTLSKVNAKTRVKIVKMAASKLRTHKEIGEIFNVRTIVVS